MNNLYFLFLPSFLCHPVCGRWFNCVVSSFFLNARLNLPRPISLSHLRVLLITHQRECLHPFNYFTLFIYRCYWTSTMYQRGFRLNLPDCLKPYRGRKAGSPGLVFTSVLFSMPVIKYLTRSSLRKVVFIWAYSLKGHIQPIIEGKE